ncbi:MAG TPA: MAPEG family protein, partial [Sphingorhabdus sp.]|nr:MAPEG family protein [Sphingorhabdus sp.]
MIGDRGGRGKQLPESAPYIRTCPCERRAIPLFPRFATIEIGVKHARPTGRDYMLSLPVTLTIAAGAALVNIWLMVRCGQARTKESVSIGDGGNEFVIRRMRAHANFVESA